MSIVIRGMAMPENCAVCQFWDDCRLLAKAGFEDWVSVDDAVQDGNLVRLENCPIIPIPEGHGELIERKRLDLVPDYKNVRNGIKHILKETKRDGRAIAGISIELLEQTIVALDELRSVRRYFENAPTIVPAEGGTGNV